MTKSPPKLPSPAERLAAIEALDDMVICLDAELRVLTWNAAAERMLGRPAESAIGSALLSAVSPPARLSAGKLFARAVAGERVPRQDLLMLKRDGAEVLVSVAISPVGDARGGTAALVLLGRDMAAQQRLQIQMLQSKRMESTGQLAGGVAHEFNNILTAILALADFTARALPPDAAARQDIEEIRQQATSGAKLVRHLLAFSRRQLLNTEVVHVGAIFQELEPLLQRLVSERILIATDVASDTRAVQIDRAQMEVVLLELVSNASDAMGDGGTLTIAVKPVEVTDDGALEPGDYVQMTLRDSGPGVGPDERARVFEPFYTTKGEGHPGLGLAMVEGVIQQHGGSVSIDSTPGEGTTVTLLLPASDRVNTAETAISPAAANAKEPNETVLVVEDETAVRNIVCRSLRDRGYHVIEAKNGEDALLVAERHNAPIHLVVTDVVMPEMSGTELYHHLRRWYPTMRILFISGYAKGAIPPEALADGVSASFLAKPFTLEALLSEVRRMIHAPRHSTSAAV